jgi:hypothetical protein
MQKQRIPLATCSDYQLEVENGSVTRIKVKPSVFCSFQSIAVSKYLNIKADNFSPSDYTILVTDLYDCIVESNATERMVNRYSGSVEQQYKDKVKNLEAEIISLKFKLQSQAFKLAVLANRRFKESTPQEMRDLFDKLK